MDLCIRYHSYLATAIIVITTMSRRLACIIRELPKSLPPFFFVFCLGTPFLLPLLPAQGRSPHFTFTPRWRMCRFRCRPKTLTVCIHAKMPTSGIQRSPGIMVAQCSHGRACSLSIQPMDSMDLRDAIRGISMEKIRSDGDWLVRPHSRRPSYPFARHEINVPFREKAKNTRLLADANLRGFTERPIGNCSQ